MNRIMVLVAIFSDTLCVRAALALPQSNSIFPDLSFVEPIILFEETTRAYCERLESLVEALPDGAQVLLLFSSTVLVPFCLGTFRSTGRALVETFPNKTFFVGNNSMANPVDPSDRTTVLLKNPNVYRFGDNLSNFSVEAIKEGLSRLYQSASAILVSQKGDNASRSAVSQYKNALDLLGWPYQEIMIEFDPINIRFDLGPAVKAISAIDPEGETNYVILTAANGNLNNEFTSDALEQDYFQPQKSSVAKYGSMNYDPESAIPVDFYYTSPNIFYTTCRLVASFFSDASAIPNGFIFFLEALEYIQRRSTKTTLSFYGQLDNEFYLDSSNTRLTSSLSFFPSLPANVDPSKINPPVILAPNPLNPYAKLLN